MSNDAKINEFRQTIETKRDNLGKKPKAVFVTNALLDVDGQKINLNTLNSEEQCVYVAGQLLVVADTVTRANKALGTKVVPSCSDFTVDEWIKDIKLRVKILKWDADKKKLTAMDKTLAALMSDDAKTGAAIADIAAQLED
jgi:hypothetical protein